MTAILAIILFLVLLTLAIMLVTCFAIGIGYIIALLFSFSLFQATVLCLAATFVAAFIMDKLAKPERFSRVYDDGDYTDYDESFDEDDDEELDVKPTRVVNDHFAQDTYRKVSTIFKPPKVGRNDPCPCGSGKKYKFCCEKKESHRVDK